MKPVLFLKNITIEGPSELGKHLNRRNITFHVCDLSAGETLDGFDPQAWRAIVPLGGPMNVDEEKAHPWLATEKQWIRDAVEAHVPIMGICLGGQLLASALGATVSANPEPEIGWLEVELTPEGQQDRLFGEAPSPLPVFQWHGDTFAIPESGVRLAQSPVCSNQAFRVGDNAYGIQFHVEVNETDVAEWARTYWPEIRSEKSRTIARRLIDAPDHQQAGRVQQNAVRIFDRFLNSIAPVA